VVATTESSGNYITNINRALKNVKSKVIADFVWADQAGIVIVTNKVVSQLNFQTIEKYVKNASDIDINKVEVPRLPQSKSYLNIIDILYQIENTNTYILADVVKFIIRSNHIFNNITIASKLHIIKISLKSDMSIIWLDI